jgi:NAD(P)-dependent dehydrogenase (short-subunit alcohol dehydrogenase family)
MIRGRLMVVGATGDIGVGVVAAAAGRAWNVVAVARNEDRLAELAAGYDERVTAIPGSIADDESCSRVADRIGSADAVVISVHPSYPHRPILEWPLTSSTPRSSGTSAPTWPPHVVSCRSSEMAATTSHSAVGRADLVLPKWVPLAAQAAQRQLYRGLVRENWRAPPVRIRELLVRSIVNGPSTRAAGPARVAYPP